ncbi:decaprenyl-phosphate phosphoribosyltransferase [Methanolobus bombayensis]|uniref:decaprenyl-phosphate phosphoribosyltransferase n=1 Tax=Methanolobus bombayensis TaxID=38023 RepID=UPI001AE961E8|nr:decaprenyl-phosphate phosphoribosyltransferase [Methanolobus bombayensis]MBP1908201.1 4-hydroxybenzoate polyprenyltransferase [Methanolobus bombayensis]
MISALFRTMRPKQWYKNLVVFVAIVFSGNLGNFDAWSASLITFFVFCLISSSVYVINDIVDAEKDKQHPVKKNRPIASGELKRGHAFIFSIILLVISLGISFNFTPSLSIISGAYFVLFLLYSLVLKQIVIVDVLTISIGFVMRAAAGAVAISVVFSPWLVICTFLVAMFLGLGKRRHEIYLLGDSATAHRKILDDYSTMMLEQMITIITASLVVSYSLYTFFSGRYYMMLTIPLAVYGLFRYLFLIHTSDFGGEPEMLFKDAGMVGCILIWVIMVLFILHFTPVYSI